MKDIKYSEEIKQDAIDRALCKTMDYKQEYIALLKDYKKLAEDHIRLRKRYDLFDGRPWSYFPEWNKYVWCNDKDKRGFTDPFYFPLQCEMPRDDIKYETME